MSFHNPFAIDRAEQLGDKLFEFYISSERFEGLLRSKSVVIRGGRGSGKTMFLLYNSYFHRKRKFLNESKSFEEFVRSLELIGIRYRAETHFVTAFIGNGLEEKEWTAIFGHYLNISLTQKLCEVAIDINNSVKDSNSTLRLTNPENISKILGSQIKDFQELSNVLEIKEIELLQYINNVGQAQRPILIGQGLLFNSIANSMINHDLVKHLKIHFFIDEYENLLQYQQQYINTFIKHPEPIIFDVGMRNEGFKTFKTLGDSETIDYPHDFDLFDIDELTDAEYENFLIEICKNRLSKHPLLSDTSIDPKFLDIRYYLKNVTLEEEVIQVLSEKRIQGIRLSLISQINNKKSLLTDSENPIHLCLHLVLLRRGNTLKQLETEYQRYLDKKPSKYKEWIHNNQNGIVFLLLKDLKQYHGFNMFKQLSSGIVRYFIELCEAAFKNAYREGFSFNDPRPLTSKEQTFAANYVSRYKINDIDHYTPYSSQLKRFIIYLGKIFLQLHRDLKLSEPERNHFSTDYEKLSDQAKEFLRYACMYSCLQRRRNTKEKTKYIDSNEIEFHLNHIYAPYFKISPRRIRKLEILPKSLETLMLGDVESAQKIANKITNGIVRETDEVDQLSFFND
ncbi:MAG: hypothetical protein ACFHWX_21055 [Bacteroidota bacterium]